MRRHLVLPSCALLLWLAAPPAMAAGLDGNFGMAPPSPWPSEAVQRPIALSPDRSPFAPAYLSQAQTEPKPPAATQPTPARGPPSPAIPQAALKAESEKRWGDAERVYRGLLAKEPDRVDLLLRLNAVLAAQGKNLEAAHAMAQAADLRPQDAELQIYASEAFAAADRPSDALRYIDRALALRPHDLDIHQRRARLAAWAGKYAEAAESLRALIAARPADLALKRDLGRVLNWENRPQEAEGPLSAYLKQHPDDKDALFALAQVEAVLGKTERATGLLDRYRAAGGDEATYNRERAQVLPRAAMLAETEKRWPEAERIYRQMLAKEPANVELGVRLADVLAAAGKRSEAAQTIAKAADQEPGDADLQLRVSEDFAGLGRPLEALKYVDRALAIRPHDPDILQRRARLATWAGKYAEAAASLQALIAADPADLRRKRDLGRVRSFQGRYNEAARLLSEYLAQHPDDKDVLLELARIEAMRHRRRAAIGLLGRYRKAGGDEKTYRRELALLRRPIAPGKPPGAAAAVPPGVIAAEGKKHWAEAERTLRAALDREPGRIDLWQRLSQDLAVQGKRREAARALAKAADLRPRDVDLQVRTSEGFAFADLPAEALRYVDRALALRPHDLDLQRRRARLAAWAGNNREAEASLRALLKANPNDLTAKRDLGRVLGWAGHADQAVGLLSEYLAQRPGDKDAMLDLARNQAGRGNSAAAADLLRRYRKAGGSKLTYRRELALVLVWAGRSRSALALADAGLADNPGDFQLRFARAVAERDGYEYGQALADLKALARLRPKAAEVGGLRRTIEVRERPYLEFAVDARHESDRVSGLASETAYHQPINDVWWLLAGGDIDYVTAPSSSVFAPIGDGTDFARGAGWVGAQARLGYGAIGLARLGETSAGRDGAKTTWHVAVDDRRSDDLRLLLTNLRDLMPVSPRAISLGISRIDTTAQAIYTPDLLWTVVALGEEGQLSDGNRLLRGYVAPRRAILRTQFWNLDLGVSGNWFGYRFNPPGDGYYSPLFFQQYLANAVAYYKIDDQDGVSLVASLGVVKDNTLRSFRFSNSYAVETTFGALSDWMVKVRAGYTNSGTSTGIFSAESVGVTLVRRF